MEENNQTQDASDPDVLTSQNIVDISADDLRALIMFLMEKLDEKEQTAAAQNIPLD
jgi:hypothetical protein